MEFESADVSGDGCLTFDEFCGLMRSRAGGALSRPTLRSWFNLINGESPGHAADTTLSIDEYFRFAVAEVSSDIGGLDVLFHPYDKDGNGELDTAEFMDAMDELGFDSAVAAMIAQHRDAHGRLKYSHMMRSLRDARFTSASMAEVIAA